MMRVMNMIKIYKNEKETETDCEFEYESGYEYEFRQNHCRRVAPNN